MKRLIITTLLTVATQTHTLLADTIAATTPADAAPTETAAPAGAAVSTESAAPADTAKATKENKLTIDVDLLSRGELRMEGLANQENGEDLAAFVITRTVLGVGYERGGLSARISAQHSGVWGSSETNSLNLYEAWARLSSKKGFFATIGRQRLSYDDQRIFGTDDWAMTSRSHDALKLGYEGHGHKLHLIGAYNQNIRNMQGGTYYSGGLQPYKAMQALWYHYDVPTIPLGISALFMNVGMQNGEFSNDTCTFQQQLIGTYIKYSPKRLTAEAAFYYQMGKEENGLPLGAWMASAKLTYDPSQQLRVYAGYDHLSGDKDFAVPPKGMFGMVRHGKVRGFSSIYGSHHKFYGAMDFFYVTTYVGGFTPGLQNLYVGTNWKPLPKLNLGLAYHFLSIATDIIDHSRPLGHELELTASYQIFRDVRISAGYSFMRGTDTMVALKRTSDNRQLQWAWLMLSVSPKIFSAMW